jgi:hypothetical protein
MSSLQPAYSLAPPPGKSGRGDCGRRLPQAALAISATRSQVIAWKPLRALTRASHAGRFGRSAVSGPHSGVWARKSMWDAARISASVNCAPARQSLPPRSGDCLPLCRVLSRVRGARAASL